MKLRKIGQTDSDAQFMLRMPGPRLMVMDILRNAQYAVSSWNGGYICKDDVTAVSLPSALDTRTVILVSGTMNQNGPSGPLATHAVVSRIRDLALLIASETGLQESDIDRSTDGKVKIYYGGAVQEFELDVANADAAAAAIAAE